jgi:ribA/ribD-fused uncharacterized protein
MIKMYPDANQKLTYETDGTIYFFLGAFDPLGNFSSHAIELWSHVFPTVEHAFQWKKFEKSNPEWAQKILSARSAWLARKLGQEGLSVRPDWRGIRTKTMTEIIETKVSQHEDVREMLLKTGNKKIIENSPIDDYWGCGADGKGQNNMGKILMRVRKQIAGNPTHSKSHDDSPTLEAAKLYTDGGSRGNPGPSAAAFVICKKDDSVVKKTGIYLGATTNNQAEYRGVEAGLKVAIELGVNNLSVYMDSELIIRQLNGVYKIKNKDLLPIYQEVKHLADSFEQIEFVHIPRELNKIADAEVNRVLDENASVK